MTLKQYVKNVQTTATSLFGYVPWPVGCMPNTFQVKQAWRLSAPDSARLLGAAKDCFTADTFVGYIVSFDTAKKMIIPVGYGIVNMKQWIIRPEEEKEL